jgi:hypothetical protein
VRNASTIGPIPSGLPENLAVKSCKPRRPLSDRAAGQHRVSPQPLHLHRGGQRRSSHAHLDGLVYCAIYFILLHTYRDIAAEADDGKLHAIFVRSFGENAIMIVCHASSLLSPSASVCSCAQLSLPYSPTVLLMPDVSSWTRALAGFPERRITGQQASDETEKGIMKRRQTRQEQEVNVVFGFDLETDIGSLTPYYEGLIHATPRILNLLAKHDISATFFFTGDAAKSHRGMVKAVDRAGHEVGCHSLYHETVGDELFSIPGVKPLLPEECAHRIEVATAWVHEALGGKVTSFRAPRLWGSTAMVNALESLGYTADASYPLYFYRERLVPYHPSRMDWTKEGHLRILEIPNFGHDD